MDERELRIGNYLSRLDNSIFRVSHYDFKRILTLGKSLHPKPIPITEEWLIEKAGFIKVNGWDDIILFIKDGVELEFIDGRFYNHCDIEIKYVHQVQNYYYSSKLTELQINK